MSAAVEKLLHSFDTLSEDDKMEALSEVIRRAPDRWPGDLEADDLVALADDLFQKLDADEIEHADA